MNDSQPHFDSPNQAHSILIIGCGFAGLRFVRACDYLRTKHPNLISRITLCDNDSRKLDRADSGFARYDSVSEALRAEDPSAVVVAVNERMHYDVLSLLGNSRKRVVLCEKPLTDTYAHSKEIERLLRGYPLSMNLVERFSPIIQSFFRWRESHSRLETMRVEAFWGKNRIKDLRPTMGVFSEIIHPLDLIDYLFSLRGWKVADGRCVSSNFSCSDEVLPDSVDVLLEMPGYPAIIRSSFVWEERMRLVNAIMSGGGREIYYATFAFDRPFWDCDSLTICSIDADTGAKQLILSDKCENSDFPLELREVYKISEFVRRSLLHLNRTEPCDQVVELDQIIKLEAILDRINTVVRTSGQVFSHSFNKDLDTTYLPMEQK